MPDVKIVKIVSLLESVASGQMDPALALKEWPDIDSETDDLIATGWHELSHYENDVDLRESDSEYDANMRALLKKWAVKIRGKYGLL